jgi:aryl-alcohol dehydrogenase-like predicted oxidoreductase
MALAEIGTTRPLGKTGVDVSSIGVGTNRWSKGKNDAAVTETYCALLDGKSDFIDTAEIYGFGKSERLIGDCLKSDPRPAFVASKFAPFIARMSPKKLASALDASLERLGRKTIDLYYIHFSFPFADLGALADALVEAVKSGKARTVGVSNFNADQLRRTADRLSRAGIPLAANEVHYSLLHRHPERNGVLSACKETGASLVAYFPLASGRLTRAPDPAKPDKSDPLRRVLSETAEQHQASAAQVALSWLLARDPSIIPIPGATKAAHARANIGALGIRLSEDEFARIDRASQEIR